MTDHGEGFADLLGRYLVRAGLTQKELANKIGVHRNTLVKWLNRSSPPESRGQVLQLADELSLTKEERKAFIQAAGFSLERWPTDESQLNSTIELTHQRSYF
jgi:transcriptional regulator with XRE-family HTH domain